MSLFLTSYHHSNIIIVYSYKKSYSELLFELRLDKIVSFARQNGSKKTKLDNLLPYLEA